MQTNPPTFTRTNGNHEQTLTITQETVANDVVVFHDIETTGRNGEYLGTISERAYVERFDHEPTAADIAACLAAAADNVAEAADELGTGWKRI